MSFKCVLVHRFAKECSCFNLTFSAMDSLDLWKKILDGQTSFNLPDKALVATYQKSHYIYQLLSDTFNLHQNHLTSAELKKGTYFDEPMTKDYTAYYTQLHNFIGKDYATLFSGSLHGENDFLADVAFAAPFVNLEKYAYRKKVTSIEPIIKNMLDNPHCKNWGLIRNELRR